MLCGHRSLLRPPDRSAWAGTMPARGCKSSSAASFILASWWL